MMHAPLIHISVFILLCPKHLLASKWFRETQRKGKQILKTFDKMLMCFCMGVVSSCRARAFHHEAVKWRSSKPEEGSWASRSQGVPCAFKFVVTVEVPLSSAPLRTSFKRWKSQNLDASGHTNFSLKKKFFPLLPLPSLFGDRGWTTHWVYYQRRPGSIPHCPQN